MTRTVEVEVFGQAYVLQGDAEESYFHELAGYVDGQMHTLAKQMKTGTPTKLAILAAINIADQLLQLERRRQAGEAELERRTIGMMEQIERQIDPNLT